MPAEAEWIIQHCATDLTSGSLRGGRSTLVVPAEAQDAYLQTTHSHEHVLKSEAQSPWPVTIQRKAVDHGKTSTGNCDNQPLQTPAEKLTMTFVR